MFWPMAYTIDIHAFRKMLYQAAGVHTTTTIYNISHKDVEPKYNYDFFFAGNQNNCRRRITISTTDTEHRLTQGIKAQYLCE